MPQRRARAVPGGAEPGRKAAPGGEFPADSRSLRRGSAGVRARTFRGCFKAAREERTPRKTAISAFISASKKLLIIFTKMKCSFHIALIYYNRAQEKAPDTLSFTSFISFFSTNRNASRPETDGFRFETYPLFLILSSAGVANRQCGRPKAIAFAHSDLYPLCRGVFNFRKYFSSPVER